MKHDHQEEDENKTIEYIKFFALLVFIALLALSTFNLSGSLNSDDIVRLFMGYFLVTFSAFKLIGYSMFKDMFPTYDLIAKKVKSYAALYPFIELGLGLLFLFDLFVIFRSLTVIVLMGIGALGIYHTVFIKGSKIRCACLGNIIKLDLSTVSLAEDVLMVSMSLYMLAQL